MFDVTRRRPEPPSLAEPPGWLRELPGFAQFQLEARPEGWASFPEGMSETTEFPGGTWRVTMLLPADLSLLQVQHVDSDEYDIAVFRRV